MCSCILPQMLHVRIPNLIYPNHPCTHIVDQYKHLQANPVLSSLFVHKLILDPRDRNLNHANPLLSCLLHQCCLPFSVSPFFSLYVLVPKNQTKDILGQFVQVFPIHVSRGRDNATLCPCQPEIILQVSYIFPNSATWLSWTSPGLLKNAIGIVPSKQKQNSDVI